MSVQYTKIKGYTGIVTVLATDGFSFWQLTYENGLLVKAENII
jgi:hypothetical protein